MSTSGSYPSLFDPGEVAILRSYFGLRPRKVDPPLADLYELQESEHPEEPTLPSAPCPRSLRRPVRLRRVDESACVNDLSHAVAKICLSGIQHELPQWYPPDESGPHGRYRFEQPKRLRPLRPLRVLGINWAFSAPGFDWPEVYYSTHIPGLGRYVVTASIDSPETHFVNDFAIGWFRDAEDPATGSRRIIGRWWRTLANEYSQGAWEEAHGGLIDERDAWSMRRRVWPDADEDVD
jgi:hypothetical protein